MFFSPNFRIPPFHTDSHPCIRIGGPVAHIGGPVAFWDSQSHRQKYGATELDDFFLRDVFWGL